MSLLGIDVGTTACKVSAFSLEGELIATASAEYDIQRRQPGWAELDARDVWDKIKRTICAVTVKCASDPVQTLAVSSMGEAAVPVSLGRQVLGMSIMNFDIRGAEYWPEWRERWPDEQLYRVNGNTWGNHYGVPKLRWIRDHQPELYARTDKFLLWSSFVAFMLGGEPVVDYSLANRTLLFDLARGDWSEELLGLTGLDRAKLPETVPSGTRIGKVSAEVAAELGLPPGALIIAGAHDQNANAVGCGVIQEGSAVYGMGTFVCITPVFSERRAPALMVERDLNTEHHAVPDKYVCFIYNQGGSSVKWFRDTFASEHRYEADIYDRLFAEIPADPSRLLVLADFATRGAISELRLDISRGEILKGIVEGTTFDLRERIESLPPTGIAILDFRAVGGGSKSNAWIQICADILGRPFVRPKVTEAGALGAAIIAGVGSGLFPSYAAGVEAMVRLDRNFAPDPRQQELYTERYVKYRELKRRLN